MTMPDAQDTSIEMLRALQEAGGSITIHKANPAQGELWSKLERMAEAGLLHEEDDGPSSVTYWIAEDAL
jgi:hypothetical protein